MSWINSKNNCKFVTQADVGSRAVEFCIGACCYNFHCLAPVFFRLNRRKQVRAGEARMLRDQMSGSLELFAKLKRSVPSKAFSYQNFGYPYRLAGLPLVVFFALLPQNTAPKSDMLDRNGTGSLLPFRVDSQQRVDALPAFLITMTTSGESIDGGPLLSLNMETIGRFYSTTNTHIQVKYTVENLSDNCLVRPFKIEDDFISSIECLALPASGLAPRDKTICTGKYVSDAADVDGGSIFHSASVETQRDYVRSVSPKIWHEISATRFPAAIFSKMSIPAESSGRREWLDIRKAGPSAFKFENLGVHRTFRGGLVNADLSLSVEKNSDVVSLPDFQCSSLQGTVFDDKNYNGLQDSDEQGLPGVQLTTPQNGLFRTDLSGHFEIECIDMSEEFFTRKVGVKLDTKSLPVLYHLASDASRYSNFQDGKFEDLNFAVVKQRLVRFDVAGEAFGKHDNRLLPEWQFTIGHVISTLRKEPSILRLSYLLTGDPYPLGKSRVQILKNEIMNQWSDAGHPYELNIETQIVGSFKNYK
jgi:hypothetical protein